ncbi:dsDNA nuclease domain-containing protein [Paenibacillus sp. P32E]|uniref:nSTAND3 domain-containing NTPase n=1 Tax=Paenibacillus sp. P32E TaxID=1349434 RepID=UPI00093BEA60|nr:dsDNA nuclease domain-containing protein [Paenibacillus sp. P32E]OKP83730.1 hypothetical protein A3848_25975 [Paenibacillus sp. P32E]
MSVEKTGPKGYEYQYIVSANILLEVLDKENIQVFIESKNGEDLQIVFDEKNEKYIYDIQVKQRSRQIEIDEFCLWMSHFEERSYESNLLTKLNSDNNRFVLFVTNSRCKDSVSNFVSNKELFSSIDISINDNVIEDMRFKIIEGFSKDKPLEVKRRNFLLQFLSQVNNNEFRNILKKARVRDMQEYELVQENIYRILNRKFYVPQSEVEEVTGKLVELVKYGRDSGLDITSNILKLLREYNGNRVFNYDDRLVERSEKESCLRILGETNVLLFTGLSFCGKTYLAREIGQSFQENGYKVLVTSDLYGDSGGITFLRHSSYEDRLLILEDPFGQVYTNEKSAEIVSNLKKIIFETKQNRKIIVTTRKDILLNVMHKDQISNCNINNNVWIDLTVTDSKFAEEIWSNYYGDSHDSLKLYAGIKNWLKRNEGISFLQPGQIMHLYFSENDIKKLEILDENSIIGLSRVDSSELAQKIDNRGAICKKIFIVLGMSCNTIKKLHLDDLAFILSNSPDEPGIDDSLEKGISIVYGAGKKSKPKHPTYSMLYNINNDYKSEIKYLLNHGYIKIEIISKKIYFSHPIYHYASKLLFQSCSDDIFDASEISEVAKRALASLDKDINLCAINLLEWYYNNKKEDHIKQMIFRCLDSIYPSVKDRVIIFFNNNFSELDEQEQKKFADSIKFQDTAENEGILWHNGNPYFNLSKEREFSFFWLLGEDNESKALKLKEKFIGNEILSAEDMWYLLNSKSLYLNDSVTLDLLKLGLTYDESFIREKSMFTLFKDYAYQFSDLKKYFDLHEHPNVIFNLFKGALTSWNKYNFEFKEEIIYFYKNALFVTTVALRSVRFLETFEDEHSNEGISWSEFSEQEKRELWLVWYDVFIELLQKFPSKFITMNEAHMVNVIRTSLKYIFEESKVVGLTSAWIEWMDEYSKYYFVDDYGMSVAKYLMEGTKDERTLRQNVFDKLVSASKTSFITTHIKTFVDYWELLSNYEKSTIFKLLNSERTDINWIIAVILNCDIVPSEIQKTIFGELLFEKNIEQIVDRLDARNLLEYCVNIHCGFPQPLWWNGYHHNNYEVWDKVILEVLRRNNTYNRSFDISLRELIDCLYNHNRTRFREGIKFLKNEFLCDPSKRELMFNKLLTVTITQNQVNKKLWDILIDMSEDTELQFYFEKIVEVIESVQYYQTNYGDLLGLFDKEIVFNELIPRLDSDELIIQFCNTQYEFKKIFDGVKIQNGDLKEKMNTAFILFINKVYSTDPPRLSLSNKFVLKTMKKLNITDKETTDMIEKNRKFQSDTAVKMKERFNDEYKLDNWIE